MKRKNKFLIGRFVRYYRNYKGLFALDMLCAFVVAMIDLAFPLISRYCMQNMLPNKAYAAFFTIMGALVLVFIIRALLYYIITYLGHMLGVKIEGDMRRELFGHMQTLPYSFFDRHRTGQLMSRVTTDLFEITELAHHGPEDLFISMLTMIGALIAIAFIRWEMALIIAVAMPVLLLLTISFRRRMMRTSKQVKSRTAEINSSVEAALSGMRTAKAFANEDEEKRKFDLSTHEYGEAKRGYYKTMGMFHGGIEFAIPVINILVIAGGGMLIMRGKMDFVELVTLSLFVSSFMTPIRKLSTLAEQFVTGMAGFVRFTEIMDTQPDIRDAENAHELTNVKGEIRFNNVSFSYDRGSRVLCGINAEIKPGEKFAVVGPTGGGKTTFCHLIPRFYDVEAGSVTIDGVDVRDVTQHSLRSNIGFVQQDVFLFAGTIMENIRYGRLDATEQEVMEAAKKAEIHEDIMNMPNGYDTYVGERGVLLSGGQKQRVAIARVFLKDPKILILDEATSALDSVTEQKIQTSLDKLAKGRTTIMIAHRLSTIKDADIIAVVDHNGIAEQGSHSELVRLGGEYARMVQAQNVAQQL